MGRVESDSILRNPLRDVRRIEFYETVPPNKSRSGLAGNFTDSTRFWFSALRTPGILRWILRRISLEIFIRISRAASVQ
jgi:hypothetical protein